MNPTARYTMGVLAQSASDAVQCAGALMFDRAAAGWDVTVYTPPEDTCSLAITIVGAKHRDLETLFSGDAPFPTVLVVTTSLHAASRPVEAHVAAALATHATEVLFTAVDDAHDAVYEDDCLYTFGSAASAFKKIAVQAAGVQIATFGPSEHFLPSPACRPLSTVENV